MPSMLDAVVVGAGPNGLTAAVELARRGFSVAVFEAGSTVGGGARTEELTLPGFLHDPCSAVHPLGFGSPVFKTMPLDRYGLEWLHPRLPMAHPWDDGTAAVLSRSVAETAASFGPRDAGTYRRLVAPYLGKWDTLARDFMSLPLTALPRDPVTLARFGLDGMRPSTWLMRRFQDDKARALFAGLVGHVIAPLGGFATTAVGLVFALAAHEGGWPMPRGGSQSISDALTAYLKDLGGAVHTDYEVKRLDDLPPARAYIFDTSPTALARIAGFGSHYDHYRYGASVFKIDYALDGPVPWTAEAPRQAGTVQIGPTSGEIGAALNQASSGTAPARPSSSPLSPASSTPAAPPRASSRSGRTAMCRTAGRAISPMPWSARSSASPPASVTWSWPAPPPDRPNWPPATPTTWAATSPAARPVGSNWCCAPSCRCVRTTPRTRRSSSVPQRPRRARACTACPATTRPRRSGADCARRGTDDRTAAGVRPSLGGRPSRRSSSEPYVFPRRRREDGAMMAP